MCGIFAAVNNQNSALSSFTRALNLQAHRGPNDIGAEAFANCLLGHTRLSILDLSSAGHQPMKSRCGKVALIFNGEVYNFKELRSSLIALGYEFFTDSDTEVIIASFLEYGIDCVKQFIGMFAFIIVDHRTYEPITYVVRDRLGIKPLFYYQHDSTWLFSSEIKSILAFTKQKFTLNKRTVSSYLSFRHSILGESFFDGINSVEPGTYWKIANNAIEKTRYWNLAESVNNVSDEDKGEQFYLDQLDALLRSAISYRMVSDVPFGAYLSGGVDSSLVTAIMSDFSDEPIKTYTIGFNEPQYNEFEFADIVAQQYKTAHKVIELNAEDYFTTMHSLIEFKDAPLSVPNEVPLYLMSKELKKDITVVLSGEGADEIFGGYGRIFRSADDFSKQDSLLANTESELKYNKKYENNRFNSELEHFYFNYTYTKPELKHQILAKNIDWSNIDNQLKDVFNVHFNEVADSPYSTKMMYVFERVHLQGLLARVDATTMAASVEARVPFVDHRLVEFAFSIPLKYKLKWNNEQAELDAAHLLADEISENYDCPKYILKKVGEKYLPNSILYRKKMGFPVPLDKWLSGDFSKTAIDIISEKGNKANSVIDAAAVIEIINSGNLQNNHSLALKIWMVINLYLFCDKYQEYLN
ncbi:MAG: asparagine synthase (glutamine-hydrolyzing) [Paraglaciecola sp.]|nr:asparagine synthase (glutamine-hydrolyzing) [Paraglaciecola sp.]